MVYRVHSYLDESFTSNSSSQKKREFKKNNLHSTSMCRLQMNMSKITTVVSCNCFLKNGAKYDISYFH